MLSEFELITRYFTPTSTADSRIALGVGDDCALLRPSMSTELAISTDMLVEGRHFFQDANPEWLGHKCLAVNLSDLAAMGAEPVAFTLALSLPDVNPEWLAAFSKGMLELAASFDCSLIGGDTTKGPLTICITVFGECPSGASLRRDGAQPGDDIWISGSLGDARLALAHLRNEHVNGRPFLYSSEGIRDAEQRLHRPTPRVALGMALRHIATSAIDISDGFAGDLGHILDRSACGATVDVDALPAGQSLAQQSDAIRRNWTLSGGDDYELCFTASPDQRAAVISAGKACDIAVTRVGLTQDRPGLHLQDASGAAYLPSLFSFDHFRTA